MKFELDFQYCTPETAQQKNSATSSTLKELRSNLNEEVGVDDSISLLQILNSIN